MQLAESCIYCSTSFENWVSGKINNHIKNHIEKGDLAKVIPKEESRWEREREKLEKF